MSDHLAEAALFDIEAPPPVSLADKFGVPPMSVLDRRSFHNDAVLLDQVGTAAVRAERPFRATRKLTRVHQHLLIFVKGDAKRAASRLEGL